MSNYKQYMLKCQERKANDSETIWNNNIYYFDSIQEARDFVSNKSSDLLKIEAFFKIEKLDNDILVEQ